MLGFLRDLYFTGFTIFYRVGGADWTSGINSGKGVAGVTLVQSAFLLSILCWIDMLIGTKLPPPKWTVLIAFLVLCVANHYPLVSCGHGTRFEREFTGLQSPKKAVLVVGFVLVLLSALASFVFSARVHRTYLGRAANHPAATNPAMTTEWQAEGKLRRFVDWNR
jgi:hypothetical protein